LAGTGGYDWVLVVEDDPDHRLLIREAIVRVAGEGVVVHEVENGVAAIYLLGTVDDGDGELSSALGLVVLDLGLPGPSGFDVLEWLRDQPSLDRVGAAVLTASENPLDAEHAFNLGARGYFQKPTEFVGYLEVFRRLMAPKTHTASTSTGSGG